MSEKEKIKLLEKENSLLKAKVKNLEDEIENYKKILEELVPNSNFYSNNQNKTIPKKENKDISINDSVLAMCLQEEFDRDNRPNVQLPQLKVNVKKNMTQNEINQLGTEKFDSQKHYPNNECSFCLEKFKNSEVIRRLNCLHIFHKNCIDPWLKNNGICPIDKVSVEI